MAQSQHFCKDVRVVNINNNAKAIDDMKTNPVPVRALNPLPQYVVHLLLKITKPHPVSEKVNKMSKRERKQKTEKIFQLSVKLRRGAKRNIKPMVLQPRVEEGPCHLIFSYILRKQSVLLNW